jgi:serine palmitoyltransferase
VLNLSSFDFLGMGQSADVKNAARTALEFYGCGSCGPRGFYGTIDQHLKIEAEIAEFMGTQVQSWLWAIQCSVPTYVD